MALFDIEDLSFTYASQEKPALQNIDMHIEAGEFVCLIGKSGSGKSTLLRQLKTVLRPVGNKSGSIFFKDRPLDEVDLREQAASIGFVMQDVNAQIVTDTVWHELAFGLESLGVNPETIHIRIAEMACFFGIEPWLNTRIEELSGGQKQLLNLASIMAMDPEVLILDEPTAQLDPISANEFFSSVKKINEEFGCTVIISEQRLEAVFNISDKIVFLEKGELLFNDEPRQAAFKLMESASLMKIALPAPFQIAYQVQKKNEQMDFGPEDKTEALPLSIKEGRAWLKETVEDHPPSKRYVAEEKNDSDVRASAALSIDKLYFRYERDAADVLNGLSLHVAPHSLHCIVGGNGVGKSTLLSCICGALKPYRGKIRAFDRKLPLGHIDNSSRIAVLPQDPKNLFSKQTLKEELIDMFPNDSGPNGEEKYQIARVVDLCQIGTLLERNPYDLSGGEMQRAALAKILLLSPHLLLLDEPTKGVDAVFKEQLSSIFAELKKSNMTILLVSHDIEFCAKYADQISLIFDGKIVSTGNPHSFFANNRFYTTAANSMSRGIFENAVTVSDVVELCLS